MGDSGQRRQFSGQRTVFSGVPAAAAMLERPLPVSVIALLQLAKSCFLLLVVAVTYRAPDSLHQIPGLPALIYFAAHGRDTRGPLLPIVAVYVGLIGYGLWRLWGWARRSLIFSSALMIALWGYRFVADFNAGTQTLRTSLEQQTVYFLVFIDVVIVAYLALYDGVPQAFEQPRF